MSGGPQDVPDRVRENVERQERQSDAAEEDDDRDRDDRDRKRDSSSDSNGGDSGGDTNGGGDAGVGSEADQPARGRTQRDTDDSNGDTGDGGRDDGDAGDAGDRPPADPFEGEDVPDRVRESAERQERQSDAAEKDDDRDRDDRDRKRDSSSDSNGDTGDGGRDDGDAGDAGDRPPADPFEGEDVPDRVRESAERQTEQSEAASGGDDPTIGPEEPEYQGPRTDREAAEEAVGDEGIASRAEAAEYYSGLYEDYDFEPSDIERTGEGFELDANVESQIEQGEEQRFGEEVEAYQRDRAAAELQSELDADVYGASGEEIRTFLRENPDATGEDIQSFVERETVTSDDIRITDGEDGAQISVDPEKEADIQAAQEEAARTEAAIAAGVMPEEIERQTLLGGDPVTTLSPEEIQERTADDAEVSEGYAPTFEGRRQQIEEQLTAREDVDSEDIASIDFRGGRADVGFTEEYQREQVEEQLTAREGIDSEDIASIDIANGEADVEFTDEFEREQAIDAFLTAQNQQQARRLQAGAGAAVGGGLLRPTGSTVPEEAASELSLLDESDVTTYQSEDGPRATLTEEALRERVASEVAAQASDETGQRVTPDEVDVTVSGEPGDREIDTELAEGALAPEEGPVAGVSGVVGDVYGGTTDVVGGAYGATADAADDVPGSDLVGEAITAGARTTGDVVGAYQDAPVQRSVLTRGGGPAVQATEVGSEQAAGFVKEQGVDPATSLAGDALETKLDVTMGTTGADREDTPADDVADLFEDFTRSGGRAATDVTIGAPAGVIRGTEAGIGAAGDAGGRIAEEGPAEGIGQTGEATAESLGQAGRAGATALDMDPVGTTGALAGGLAAGVATGTAAARGVEAGANVARASRIRQAADRGDVRWRDITDETGQEGALPQFETDPRAPTQQAVDEVSERARQNPEEIAPDDADGVIFHTSKGRLDDDLEVQEGTSELPGLWGSPDASPLNINMPGSRGYNFRVGLPRVRSRDEVIALPGDDIRGMPRSARGSGYELRDADTGEVLDRGIGRVHPDDLPPGTVRRPRSDTPGYRFLTEEAEPGAQYVRPQGARSTELETITPPGGQFVEEGVTPVRFGGRTLPGTDIEIPGTGRVMPGRRFRRADDGDADVDDAVARTDDRDVPGGPIDYDDLPTSRVRPPERTITPTPAPTTGASAGTTTAAETDSTFDPFESVSGTASEFDGGVSEPTGATSEPAGLSVWGRSGPTDVTPGPSDTGSAPGPTNVPASPDPPSDVPSTPTTPSDVPETPTTPTDTPTTPTTPGDVPDTPTTPVGVLDTPTTPRYPRRPDDSDDPDEDAFGPVGGAEDPFFADFVDPLTGETLETERGPDEPAFDLFGGESP